MYYAIPALSRQSPAGAPAMTQGYLEKPIYHQSMRYLEKPQHHDTARLTPEQLCGLY